MKRIFISISCLMAVAGCERQQNEAVHVHPVLYAREQRGTDDGALAEALEAEAARVDPSGDRPSAQPVKPGGRARPRSDGDDAEDDGGGECARTGGRWPGRADADPDFIAALPDVPRRSGGGDCARDSGGDPGTLSS